MERLVLRQYLLLYLDVLRHGGLQECLMEIGLVREHAVAGRTIAGGVGRVRRHTETCDGKIESHLKTNTERVRKIMKKSEKEKKNEQLTINKTKSRYRYEIIRFIKERAMTEFRASLSNGDRAWPAAGNEKLI